MPPGEIDFDDQRLQFDCAAAGTQSMMEFLAKKIEAPPCNLDHMRAEVLKQMRAVVAAYAAFSGRTVPPPSAN